MLKCLSETMIKLTLKASVCTNYNCGLLFLRQYIYPQVLIPNFQGSVYRKNRSKSPDFKISSSLQNEYFLLKLIHNAKSLHPHNCTIKMLLVYSYQNKVVELFQ